MNRILVGSNYFFSLYEDYSSKDEDYVEITKLDDGVKYMSIQKFIEPKEDTFLFSEALNKQEHIEIALANDGLVLGKFLIPEFCNLINFTIEDLRQLEPLITKLTDKHLYEKIIYESYLQNNDFVLTEEQRKLAYDYYRKSRQED